MSDDRTSQMIHDHVLPRRHNIRPRTAPKPAVHPQIMMRQFGHQFVIVHRQQGCIEGRIPQFEHPKGVFRFHFVDRVAVFFVREIGLTGNFAGMKTVRFVESGEVKGFEDGVHVGGKNEGTVEDGRQPQHVGQRDQVVARVPELVFGDENEGRGGAFFGVVLFVTVLGSLGTTECNVFQDREPLFEFLPYVGQ